MYRVPFVLTLIFALLSCNSSRVVDRPVPPPSAEDKPNIVFKADGCDGKGSLDFFMLPYDADYHTELWLGGVYLGGTLTRKGTSQSVTDYSATAATFDWRYIATRQSDKKVYSLQFKDPATGRMGLSVPACAETPEVVPGRSVALPPIEFELVSCDPTGSLAIKVTSRSEAYDLEYWDGPDIEQRASIAVGHSHTFTDALPPGVQSIRVGAKTPGVPKTAVNPGYKLFFDEVVIPSKRKTRGLDREDCATNARPVIVDQLLEPIERGAY